ncbi:MAG: RdgB/HAM1 family non-canonical purine NTP pyrophosphatase, partial [Firmicutes bacterium]|nr:RdgB/HAM1 family non-canonical purine NTP pyrophosphatase [Bacillota bacterium]
MSNFQLVVATNNMHKLGELRALFDGLPITLLSLKDIGVEIDVEETGKTFRQNALIKAKAVAALTPLPVMADDSGLEVFALDGFPGIYSARFMAGHSYFEKDNAIIERLKAFTDKSAQFHCVMALCNVTKTPRLFEGVTLGHIDDQPRGEHGFGYDPIFISDELKTNFGLASEQDKNAVSHRGKATKQL